MEKIRGKADFNDDGEELIYHDGVNAERRRVLYILGKMKKNCEHKLAWEIIINQITKEIKRK